MRTLGRLLAVLGVIGLVLVVALVGEGSTSPASAAVTAAMDPPAVLPALIGDTAVTEDGAATLLGPICATGVGCLAVAGALAVGVGLYATHSVWMPWLTNIFGGSSSGASGSATTHTMTLSITSDGANGITVTGYENATSGSTNYGFYTTLICSVGGSATASTGGTVWTMNPGSTTSRNFDCATGAAPVYAWISPAGTPASPQTGCDTSYFACPHNYPTWSGWGGSSSVGSSGSGVSNPVDAVSQYYDVLECVDSSGGKHIYTSGSYAGGSGGFILPSCSQLGLGTHADSITVYGCPASGACAEIFSYVVPDTPSQPLCAPGSGNVCYWQVRILGTACTVGGTVAGVACSDWYTYSQANPGNVTCYWGTYLMPLADCTMLQFAYTTTGADATTGTAVGTGTGTGTSTGTGGDASTAPAPNPTVPSTSSGQCYPSGWAAFNPVEWVLKPVECALVWAFEPDPATLTTAQTTLGGDLTAAGPGPLFAAMGSLIGSLNGVGGGGCQGPAVNFDIETVHQTLYPWNACNPPMSTVASLVYDLTTLLVVVAGGLAFIRSLAAGFGFNFSMRGDSDTRSWNGDEFV